MRFIFPLLILVLTLNSCEEDPEIISHDVNRDALKFDICHYSPDTESWVVINIAEISYLKAHIDHGDTKLVDADGDGWVSNENECVPGGDCDDANPDVYPGATEVCDGVDNNCDGIVDEGCNQNGFADYFFDSMVSNFYRGTYNIITDFDCNSSLTNDGQAVLNEVNLGGSSLISKSMAMNVLNLLDFSLYKTSGQIEYDDTSGKMMDILVNSESSIYGVNVTKAVAFPYGTPYTATHATTLLESNLSDLTLAEANLSNSNPVMSSILFVFAWDVQHANVLTESWNNLDSAIKADATLIVMITEGFDEFVYTGSINTDEEVCDGIDNDCDGEVDEGCEQNEGIFIDLRDGKEYKWVKIGEQTWMAENLSYTPLDVNFSDKSQGSFDVPHYYVYNYSGDLSGAVQTDNYNTYGVLYNLPAAQLSCPEGWHLPSKEEWDELMSFLGGNESYAGYKLKEAGIEHWKPTNDGATNESGFTALPSGFYSNYGTDFLWIEQFAAYWTSSSDTNNISNYWSFGIGGGLSYIEYLSLGKGDALAIRCIKD